MAHTMTGTKNGLSYETRDVVAECLEGLLINTLDIAGQVKVAHWNVKGPFFHTLHEDFGKLAAELEGYADQLAERGVQLGAVYHVTPRVVGADSEIPEFPKTAFEAPGVVTAVLNRVVRLTGMVHAEIEAVEEKGDCVTENLLIDINAGLDKWVWMLEKQV